MSQPVQLPGFLLALAPLLDHCADLARLCARIGGRRVPESLLDSPVRDLGGAGPSAVGGPGPATTPGPLPPPSPRHPSPPRAGAAVAAGALLPRRRPRPRHEAA